MNRDRGVGPHSEFLKSRQCDRLFSGFWTQIIDQSCQLSRLFLNRLILWNRDFVWFSVGSECFFKINVIHLNTFLGSRLIVSTACRISSETFPSVN